MSVFRSGEPYQVYFSTTDSSLFIPNVFDVFQNQKTACCYYQVLCDTLACTAVSERHTLYATVMQGKTVRT